MLRRFVIASLALLCFAYQAEWPVWAALSLPDTTTMDCACRGTDQCCCRMKMRQESSQAAAHGQCHMESAPQPKKQTAQCVMKADDCGHATDVLSGTLIREPAIMAQKPEGSFLIPFPLLAFNLLELQSIIRDTPAPPPRRFSA